MKRVTLLLCLLSLFACSTAFAAEEPTTNPATSQALLFRAFGGVSRASLFSLPVSGPTGGLGFGGGIRRSWGGFDAVGDVAYDALSTPHGVGVHRLNLGASGELLLWRFRFGAGVDLGRSWIARLSGSKLGASTLYVGAHASFGFDLFTISHVSAYVSARGDLNTAMPTLGANGGLRLGF